MFIELTNEGRKEGCTHSFGEEERFYSFPSVCCYSDQTENIPNERHGDFPSLPYLAQYMAPGLHAIIVAGWLDEYVFLYH